MALLANACLLLLVALVSRAVYRLYFHPLSRIPGPFLARVSRLWLLVHAARGETHIAQLAVHRRYGPVVRVGPDHVLLADPQYGPQYYSWDKSDWWLCFRPPGEDAHLAFSTELGIKTHNAKKKRVAASYSLTSLLTQEDVFDRHVLAFWISYLNTDLLMDVVFSSPLGCVKLGQDARGLIGANETFVWFAQFIGIFPGIFGLMSLPIMQRFAPKPTDETGAGVLFGTAERAVRERLSSSADSSPSGNASGAHRDMLQSMKDWRDPATGAHIPPRQLKNEALVAMLSGADTVSCTLRVAILHLYTNARVRRKLRAELDEAASAGRLSTPVARYDELRRLPYLAAVVKELVRVHPPWRPRSGASRPTRARNAMYGDDLDAFRPERWLHIGDDERRERDRLDLFFGYGDYMCLGKGFAMVETYKTIVEVLRRFDVCVLDEQRPWKSSASISFVHEGFWCRLVSLQENGF
ncbi:hypothetical protein H2203_002839 [Taxawa tesnikishii (nom. ined.)]|nr:hypothetical protein H2203_002839 [Dothideales sp. JES 119]